MPKYLVHVTRLVTESRSIVVDAESVEQLTDNFSRVIDCATDLDQWNVEDSVDDFTVIETTEDEADLRL